MILQTQRLLLREMDQGDWEPLCAILQDPEVMYAYEHAFSDQEVQAWLDNQRRRYREDGFGLWAVVSRQTGEMIGQCGLTWQDWDGRQVLEVGYLFRRSAWGQGYATEAAMACREYAFTVLDAQEVYSIIRDSNLPSQGVARRNGMAVRGSLVKHYWGMDMPHLVFSVRRQDDRGRNGSVLAL